VILHKRPHPHPLARFARWSQRGCRLSGQIQSVSARRVDACTAAPCERQLLKEPSWKMGSRNSELKRCLEAEHLAQSLPAMLSSLRTVPCRRSRTKRFMSSAFEVSSSSQPVQCKRRACREAAKPGSVVVLVAILTGLQVLALLRRGAQGPRRRSDEHQHPREEAVSSRPGGLRSSSW